MQRCVYRRSADRNSYELSTNALNHQPPHTASSQPPPHIASIIAMLQEQQGLLNKVLHEQQDIHLQLEQNDRRMKVLEDKLNEHTDSSTSSGERTKVRTVTKDLTVRVIFCG